MKSSRDRGGGWSAFSPDGGRLIPLHHTTSTGVSSRGKEPDGAEEAGHLGPSAESGGAIASDAWQGFSRLNYLFMKTLGREWHANCQGGPPSAVRRESWAISHPGT